MSDAPIPRNRGRGRPRKAPAEGEAIAPDRECGGCECEGTQTYRGLPWCGSPDCALFIEACGSFLAAAGKK